MPSGIVSFNAATFMAICTFGITILGLLVKLVWQAKEAVDEIKTISAMVREHDPKIDNHENRIIHLEAVTPRK